MADETPVPDGQSTERSSNRTFQQPNAPVRTKDCFFKRTEFREKCSVRAKKNDNLESGPTNEAVYDPGGFLPTQPVFHAS